MKCSKKKKCYITVNYKTKYDNPVVRALMVNISPSLFTLMSYLSFIQVFSHIYVDLYYIIVSKHILCIN